MEREGGVSPAQVPGDAALRLDHDHLAMIDYASSQVSVFVHQNSNGKNIDDNNNNKCII